MRSDFYYASCGKGMIHACRWEPLTEPRGIFQIVHGIAEHVERYDAFAQFLNTLGFIVVAEDHMGHGKTIGTEGTQGYFCGGWFNAVEDSYQLLKDTMAEHPDLPYILFGHSMGSFMARTILAKYPDCGIHAAIICGTGWQPAALLRVALPICALECKRNGETNPSAMLQNLIFGGYNKRVEHQRTSFDWLTRDDRIVDAYIADPLSGFDASAGLLRDMLKGISFVQARDRLQAMNKKLPVLFIAGGDDPVGGYGTGVQKTAEAFRNAGMQNVDVQIYPLCRHEILNEINRDEVYSAIAAWVNSAIAD